jgi:hypothetical protein
MRLEPRLSLILLPLALWICFASCAEAADSARDKILNTFREYEALNTDFLSSVGYDKGKSGKPYAALRKEVEAYAEEPFETALGAAQTQVCKFKDTEIISALFLVKLATANSASESPDTTLGYMFVCQPDLVAKSFMVLPPSKQQALFSDFEFGFENAVYGESKDNERVLELRRKLQALEPGRKQ